MGEHYTMYIFIILNVFLSIKGEHFDWTSFVVSGDAIDSTGMPSLVTDAISDIHCAMQCHADITCTGMNYQQNISNSQCRLFYNTPVSDFTMVTVAAMISILPSPRSCAAMKKKHGTTTKNGAHNFVDLETVGRVVRRKSYRAFCDQQTDGGGWTVIQRRVDGSVDFFRGWDEYKHGFGNVNGELWLGLELIHFLTSAQPTELRIDLEDFEGNSTYAVYTNYTVGNEGMSYNLAVGEYRNGTAGDSLMYQNGWPFSTKDRDNDNHNGDCSAEYHGAWWYNACHESNLNGAYKGGPHASYADGVNWKSWTGYHYSLKVSEMKIRPFSFL